MGSQGGPTSVDPPLGRRRLPEQTWQSTTLHRDVQVVEDRDMPLLDEALEAEVTSVWAAERALRPALFNGRVFCADTVTADRITGHWTEYRRVLAQMRRPMLFERLQIRALAVNGLLECADGLVLGQRQAEAIYLPGCWQAAPAGNVEAREDDRLDLAEQLRAELLEELGLTAAEVEILRPVCAIEHAGTRIVDVGFLMRTSLTFQAVSARQVASGNGEYEMLRLVAPGGIPQLVQELGRTLLPSARILMGCWSSD